MKNITDWFLAFAQASDKPITQKELAKLLHAAQQHADEEGIALEGLPSGPSAWAGLMGVYIYFGKKSDNFVYLDKDFDFANFAQEENEYLVTIWNTYERK